MDKGNNMCFNKLPISIQRSTMVLTCQSIRIGLYKIEPEHDKSNISVTFTDNDISFVAPLFMDAETCVKVSLKAADTVKMMIHFGECSPIIFAFTTKSFGEHVTRTLNLGRACTRVFDPTSNDEKKNKVTFLIDNLQDEQCIFLRHIYPGPERLKEIDQNEANEVLEKTTFQHSSSTIKVIEKFTRHVKVPVKKILTYPPPPQTGGIAINTSDLATLEEGEFLNDTILDFYLKYVFYEKLSSQEREKAHIFSSYFYLCLTQNSDGPQPEDDFPKIMQIRRHNNVKTWTKKIDVFSKDHIIIPINLGYHWFVAFICYPGCIPDAPIEKAVTSSDSQETSNVIIKEDTSNNEGLDDKKEQKEGALDNTDVTPPPLVPILCQEDSSRDLRCCDTEFPDHYRASILIFDSLSGPNRWSVASNLREYLEVEWEIKKKTRKVFDENTMPAFIVKCPQQTNLSDCGLYVLQYVESFFENPIPCFGHPMTDLTHWFSVEKMSKKRQEIKELILNLQKKFQTKQF